MNFERICDGLDVEPLLQLVDANPDWWNEITIRQEFIGSAHHATQAIHLRGPASFTFDDVFVDTGAHDYPLIVPTLDALMMVLRPLLTAIDFTDIGRVMIVRLPAGGELDPHIDQGRYAAHYQRFHVALRTNDRCALVVDGETQHMAAGEAWWFDHRKPHSAFNHGDTERLHLIVDARSPRFTTG